jgi:hypothetical protein
MKKMYKLLLVVPLVILAACQMVEQSTASTSQDQATATIIAPSPSAWVTLAPYNVTSTPILLPTLDVTGLYGKIVFQSDREGDFEIYLYDFQDGSLTNLSRHDDVDVFPSWSRMAVARFCI